MSNKTKTYRKTIEDDLSGSEGGSWELLLFVVFFVLVFSAVARADQRSTSTRQNSRSANSVATKSGAAKKIAVNKVPVTAPQATVSVSKTSSTSISVTAPENEKPVRFSGGLSYSIARPAIDTGEGEVPYSGSYAASVGAKHAATGIGAKVKVSFSHEYTYEMGDGQSYALDNPSVSLSKAFKAGEDFQSRWIDSVSLSLGSSLGLSRESQRRTFYGSLGPTVGVSKGFGKVSLSQSLGYSRGFYEYDVRDNGAVNSPNSFRSSTSVGVQITEKLSAGAAFIFGHNISFQGVGRSSQTTDTSVSYQVLEKLGATLGVSSDRGTLSPDGQYNRVKFIDPDTTAIYLGLDLSI